MYTLKIKYSNNPNKWVVIPNFPSQASARHYAIMEGDHVLEWEIDHDKEEYPYHD